MVTNKLKKLFKKLKKQFINVDVWSLTDTKNLKETGHTFAILFASHTNRSGYPEIDNKLSEKKDCAYIIIDGEIAHISWIYYHNLLARQLGFKSTLVIGDCETKEKFKGMGLYGITVSHILRSDPRKKYILFIEPHNVASIKGVTKIGLQKLGNFSLKRFLGLAYQVQKND